MQFAYQFPERLERLVLVDSGGLGNEVHIVLRAATLPGAEQRFVRASLAESPDIVVTRRLINYEPPGPILRT